MFSDVVFNSPNIVHMTTPTSRIGDKLTRNEPVPFVRASSFSRSVRFTASKSPCKLVHQFQHSSKQMQKRMKALSAEAKLLRHIEVWGWIARALWIQVKLQCTQTTAVWQKCIGTCTASPTDLAAKWN